MYVFQGHPFCELYTHISLSSLVDGWKWPPLPYSLTETHREEKDLKINSKETLNGSFANFTGFY